MAPAATPTMANGAESWNHPVMATSVVYIQKEEGRKAEAEEQRRWMMNHSKQETPTESPHCLYTWRTTSYNFYSTTTASQKCAASVHLNDRDRSASDVKVDVKHQRGLGWRHRVDDKEMDPGSTDLIWPTCGRAEHSRAQDEERQHQTTHMQAKLLTNCPVFTHTHTRKANC